MIVEENTSHVNYTEGSTLLSLILSYNTIDVIIKRMKKCVFVYIDLVKLLVL